MTTYPHHRTASIWDHALPRTTARGPRAARILSETIAAPGLLAIAILPALATYLWGTAVDDHAWLAFHLEQTPDTLWIPRWIWASTIATGTMYAILRHLFRHGIARLRANLQAPRTPKPDALAAAPAHLVQITDYARPKQPQRAA